MNVLMISLDTALLTGTIGSARVRHERYAQRVGQLRIVICNRRSQGMLLPSPTQQLAIQPTNSRGYLSYLQDGYQSTLDILQGATPDLIVTQEPFLTALIGLRLRNRFRKQGRQVPLLMQNHSAFLANPYFLRERPINRLLRRLAHYTLRRADAIRVVNSGEREACYQLGIHLDKVCNIPLVPNIGSFSQPAAPEQIAYWKSTIKADQHTPILLWVGRPVAFKNLPMLIDAYRLIHQSRPDVRFIIAGDMRGTDIVERAAHAELSGVVHFPGAVKHDQLPALYQAATLYTLSSNYEGLPGVLLEASASGLPILSTDNQGARDLITSEKNGVLTSINDSAAFAQAALRLLEDEPKRRQLAINARQHVADRFDEQKLSDRWIGMWERLVQEQSPLCVS